METMGTVYTSLGLYDQAVPLLQSALDKRKALYGEKHLEVAQSLDRLGEVLKLKADHDQALPMYREALALRRKMLGNEHIDTARSVYELAELLSRMGDYAAADPLFREALALRRKLTGDEEPGSRAKHRGRGSQPVRPGQLTRSPSSSCARPSRCSASCTTGRIPSLADALNNLGWVLGELGQFEEAEQLYRQALEMQRVLLGEAHPYIAIGLNNVALAAAGAAQV